LAISASMTTCLPMVASHLDKVRVPLAD